MEQAMTVGSNSRTSQKKVLRRKESVRDVGQPARMQYENFETKLKLKPRLDLLGGDPDNPPEMRGKSGDPVNLGTDPEEPTAQEIQRKAPEYENAPSVEKMDFPHEREKVRQNNNNIKDAARSTESILEDLAERRERYRLQKKAEGADESDVESAGEEIDKAENALDNAEDDLGTNKESSADSDPDHDARLRVAMKIAEIRVKASHIDLDDSGKIDYAFDAASKYSMSQLEDKLQDHQQLITAATPPPPSQEQFRPPTVTGGRNSRGPQVQVSTEDAVFGG